MLDKLYVFVVITALLLALAACAGATPEPTAAPTPTPEPTVRPQAEEDPTLTEADRAYTQWLAEMQSGFEKTAGALIALWQSSQDVEADQLPAETIGTMEDLADVIHDYVEDVEGRQDVPAAMAQIHAALLKEVHNWEVGAPLLVESAKALRDGDEDQFEAKAEQAGEAIQAAGEARQELLEATRALLGGMQEAGSE